MKKQKEKENDYRILTESDVVAMCESHELWLKDMGGKQADFSGCLLTGFDLSGLNLINSIFKNAKLVDISLKGAELCFSDFGGACFSNCDFSGASVEEAVFKEAKLEDCILKNAIFTHSNFSKAKIKSCCCAEHTSFKNCCFDSAGFDDFAVNISGMENCSLNEQEWDLKFDPTSIQKMGG